MTAGARIIVPQEFMAWERGFGALPEEAPLVASQTLSLSVDLFFEKTQEFVHVVSGALKDSGESRVEVNGPVVSGIVEYGNDEVVYAQIEEDRGGEHAYLSRGWEAAASAFEEGMDMVWPSVVESWV